MSEAASMSKQPLPSLATHSLRGGRGVRFARAAALGEQLHHIELPDVFAILRFEPVAQHGHAEGAGARHRAGAGVDELQRAPNAPLGKLWLTRAFSASFNTTLAAATFSTRRCRLRVP